MAIKFNFDTKIPNRYESVRKKPVSGLQYLITKGAYGKFNSNVYQSKDNTQG